MSFYNTIKTGCGYILNIIFPYGKIYRDMVTVLGNITNNMHVIHNHQNTFAQLFTRPWFLLFYFLTNVIQFAYFASMTHLLKSLVFDKMHLLCDAIPPDYNDLFGDTLTPLGVTTNSTNYICHEAISAPAAAYRLLMFSNAIANNIRFVAKCVEITHPYYAARGPVANNA